MTIVVDASTLVDALTGSGPQTAWAEALVETQELVGPHLLPAEVANVLRRGSLAGTIPREVCSIAHRDLLDLSIDLHPFEPFATRAWELRSSVSTYDAWYVALAEGLDVPLATVDSRLVRAHGPRCEFLLPPDL